MGALGPRCSGRPHRAEASVGLGFPGVLCTHAVSARQLELKQALSRVSQCVLRRAHLGRMRGLRRARDLGPPQGIRPGRVYHLYCLYRLYCQGGGDRQWWSLPVPPPQGTFQQLPQHLADAHPQSSCPFKLQLFPPCCRAGKSAHGQSQG